MPEIKNGYELKETILYQAFHFAVNIDTNTKQF